MKIKIELGADVEPDQGCGISEVQADIEQRMASLWLPHSGEVTEVRTIAIVDVEAGATDETARLLEMVEALCNSAAGDASSVYAEYGCDDEDLEGLRAKQAAIQQTRELARKLLARVP